jgi:hypothetical protein
VPIATGRDRNRALSPRSPVVARAVTRALRVVATSCSSPGSMPATSRRCELRSHRRLRGPSRKPPTGPVTTFSNSRHAVEYNREMLRAARMVIAAFLALSVAALPVLLDRCAESCELHGAIAANAPACHHAASTATQITRAPAPCGHDYNGTSVTAVKSVELTGRTFASVATAVIQPLIAVPVGAGIHVDPHSPPRAPDPFARLSLPLRV